MSAVPFKMGNGVNIYDVNKIRNEAINLDNFDIPKRKLWHAKKQSAATKSKQKQDRKRSNANRRKSIKFPLDPGLPHMEF